MSNAYAHMALAINESECCITHSDCVTENNNNRSGEAKQKIQFDGADEKITDLP